MPSCFLPCSHLVSPLGLARRCAADVVSPSLGILCRCSPCLCLHVDLVEDSPCQTLKNNFIVLQKILVFITFLSFTKDCIKDPHALNDSDNKMTSLHLLHYYMANSRLKTWFYNKQSTVPFIGSIIQTCKKSEDCLSLNSSSLLIS